MCGTQAIALLCGLQDPEVKEFSSRRISQKSASGEPAKKPAASRRSQQPAEEASSDQYETLLAAAPEPLSARYHTCLVHCSSVEAQTEYAHKYGSTRHWVRPALHKLELADTHGCVLS